jgi:peptidoglycan/xylan/chitin deacetylase (PgdA/CDA1 family)
MGAGTIVEINAAKQIRTKRDLTVLNYHGITRWDDAPRFWITRARFAENVAEIRLQGCNTRLLGEAALSCGDSHSDIVVTFDDGHASDHEDAFRILSECQLRAEFFINTAAIGEKGYVTWRHIQEMSRNGMGIQSHGHVHCDLSRLSKSALWNQLSRSKRMIEDRTGREVKYLAPPFGALNQQVTEAAIAAGFRGICVSTGKLARRGGLVVDRICILGSTSAAEFRAILRRDAKLRLRRWVRRSLMYVPKQIAVSLFPNQVDQWRQKHA